MPLTTNSYNHYYEKFEDGTISDITEEISCDLPKSWNICRLNLIAYLDNGTKIQNKKLPYLEAKYLRGKTNPTYLNSGIEVFPNDFLILVDGENSGEVFINKENGYMGSTFKILNISKNMNYEYIILILKYFQNFLKNSKKGAAIPHLNKELFKKLLITIPPLSEQERIVNRLKELEPIINKYNSAYSKLEDLNYNYKNELKKSILQYAIQGKLVKQDPNDEPAEVLINRILDEKRELIKTKQIKKENLSVIYKDSTDNQFYEKFDDGKVVNITEKIPFEIPKTWIYTRLRNIGTIVGGGTPKTEIKENWSNATIPWLTPADMKNIKGIYAERGERNISEVGLNNSSAKLMPTGTILYSSRAPIGYIAIAKNEICTNQGFKSVVLINDKMNRFLYYELIQKTPEIISRASGTTFKEISGAEFGETIVAIPPLNEQLRIIEKIEQLLNIFK